MQNYDSGYDIMGESIIDALADVQKVFQHVVEAAHMEGAAYENARREDEVERLRNIIKINNLDVDGGNAATPGSKVGTKDGSGGTNNPLSVGGSLSKGKGGKTSPSAGLPLHDEFIDQDVLDVLRSAIRQGNEFVGKKANKGDDNRHTEVYKIYREACSNAAALLPVDSDHRGRLMLSVARAEGMVPDKACAILRYVMDDVSRSGLGGHTGHVGSSEKEQQKRGDCVLNRPMQSSSQEQQLPLHQQLVSSSTSLSASNFPIGRQSANEVLANLGEEMREVLSAPAYEETPLHDITNRFWIALGETQKGYGLVEEKLEQKLGAIKGEFLLAREEWEEKIDSLTEENSNFKIEISKLREKQIFDPARKFNMKDSINGFRNEHNLGINGNWRENMNNCQDFTPPIFQKGTNSVPSFENLANHARNLAQSFSCGSDNDYKENTNTGSRRRQSRDKRQSQNAKMQK